jgi:hypothetical protein
MKQEQTSFFSNLFGAKRGYSPETEKSAPVVISSYSQPHVLRQKMNEEKLTHGETVTANLSPVRLESEQGKMVMYFCPMKSIEVLETLADGDGGNIPAQAIVEGLTFPENFKPGLYTLKNVVLSSNGSIQVKATEKTIWESSSLEVF